MVKEHYPKLGFAALDADGVGGTRWVLDLESFVPADTFIDVKES
jgi:hypothetical protein